MIILRLLVGSHLYGTAHGGSDFDWYEVHDKIDSRQVISGNQDTTYLDLSTYMRQADAGVPQALEAMFAPADYFGIEVDKFRDMRVNYRPDTARAANTYARTISSFKRLKVTPKRLAHAVRLAYNLDQLVKHGKFDPTDLTWTK